MVFIAAERRKVNKDGMHNRHIDWKSAFSHRILNFLGCQPAKSPTMNEYTPSERRLMQLLDNKFAIFADQASIAPPNCEEEGLQIVVHFEGTCLTQTKT